MKSYFRNTILTGMLTGLALLTSGCGNASKNEKKMEEMKTSELKEGTFVYDVNVMKDNKSYAILRSEDSTRLILVSADLQGRVMTSTFDGMNGYSIGWVNDKFIRAGKIQKHFNPWGGEERLWLGPEGGQFSLFFKPGAPFDLDHWYTPAAFDTEPFETEEKSDSMVRFARDITLVNYSSHTFDIGIRRTVHLLEENDLKDLLDERLPRNVKWVGYETENVLENKGDQAWTKEFGMPSIWLLGMYRPSDATTIVIPFNTGDSKVLGKVVNDAYFGKISPDRLKIKDGVIFFKGDGKSRGKIGLNPERAKDVLGSYDNINHILTIVKYNKPEGVADYVNSMWEIQKDPFDGDVINAYNDGPLPDGGQLGPFYELETSSPAAVLKPGEKLIHVSQTWHFSGSERALSVIAEKILGASIGDIKNAI
ncbi:MAG: hypothetical protein J7K46_11440 [Bacteroidales bacterium]|nr:hypothetical protein [Bacteroidales bacterium]